MTNARFVRKTELSGLAMLRLDQQPVVEKFTALREAITTRVGEATANLFAEPVITRAAAGSMATISWYTPWPGDPRLLSDMALDDRPRFQAALRQAMEPVLKLIDDREIGPLLRLALVIPDESHIAFVSDHPVLTGWGLAPDAVARDRKTLSRHLSAVYGSIIPRLNQADAGFFDDLSRPALRQPAAAAAPAAAAVAAAADRPAAARPAPAKATPVIVPAGVMSTPPRGSIWSWWLLPAGIAFAMLFFALGLWFGWRYFTDQISHTVLTADITASDVLQKQLENQRQINESLEKQIAEAKAALATDMCKVTNPVAPILSTPPPGAPEPTPAPDQTPAPAATPGQAPAP